MNSNESFHAGYQYTAARWQIPKPSAPFNGGGSAAGIRRGGGGGALGAAAFSL